MDKTNLSKDNVTRRIAEAGKLNSVIEKLPEHWPTPDRLSLNVLTKYKSEAKLVYKVDTREEISYLLSIMPPMALTVFRGTFVSLIPTQDATDDMYDGCNNWMHVHPVVIYFHGNADNAKSNEFKVVWYTRYNPSDRNSGYVEVSVIVKNHGVFYEAKRDGSSIKRELNFFRMKGFQLLRWYSGGSSDLLTIYWHQDEGEDFSDYAGRWLDAVCDRKAGNIVKLADECVLMHNGSPCESFTYAIESADGAITAAQQVNDHLIRAHSDVWPVNWFRNTIM